MYVAIILGTAGSGKTMLTRSLADYLDDKGLDYAIMNLDPGVLTENLPYTPDIDVREFVRAEEVMNEYRLGPNGALIASMDLLANYIFDLQQKILEIKPEYLLVDTPGQMEIFAYRPSGPVIIENLFKMPDTRCAIVYLLDPFLCVYSPSALLSALLLVESVYWRFELPMLTALSKIDLLEEGVLEKLLKVIEEPSKLIVFKEIFQIKRDLSPLLAVIDKVQEIIAKDVIPVSAVTGEGIFDVFSNLLNVWSETG
ncbi:MAG: ATP/GTP-binding protein [Candidatus Njordarchaeales archaeon]